MSGRARKRKPREIARNYSDFESRINAMAVNPAVNQLPDNYKFGWEDKDAVYRNVKKKGLSEDVVTEISQTYKHEPEWMLQRRLKALKHYRSRPTPTWGADLSQIDFEDIYYYLQASDKSEKSWNDVP